MKIEMVKAEAKKAGITDITLRRARTRLKIKSSDKDEQGNRGPWTWRLPQAKSAFSRKWEDL